MARAAVSLLLLLTACARTPDVAAARVAVMDADRAFNRATAERRVEGWMDFFAEDGSMIRGAGTITGLAAIREDMTKAFADTSFTLIWDPDNADASGAIGYTNGHYKAQFRDAKRQPQVRTGRYLTVWKQQADSSWKVVQDIGVQDVPPPAP